MFFFNSLDVRLIDPYINWEEEESIGKYFECTHSMAACGTKWQNYVITIEVTIFFMMNRALCARVHER